MVTETEVGIKRKAFYISKTQIGQFELHLASNKLRIFSGGGVVETGAPGSLG
jgi:hypothetical protein